MFVTQLRPAGCMPPRFNQAVGSGRPHNISQSNPGGAAPDVFNYYTHPVTSAPRKNELTPASQIFNDYATKDATKDDIGVYPSALTSPYARPNPPTFQKTNLAFTGCDSGFNSPSTTAAPVCNLEPDGSRSIGSLLGQALEDLSDSDDETPTAGQHPNKFPVEIEYHYSRFCGYKRQATRSGEKIQTRFVKSFNPANGVQQTEMQKVKTYQKHLVRICKCGTYEMMDGALQQGRSNDCNGYEIHHSHKCKWKAYDDFKTGNRVLIRLCKCYKQSKN